MEKKYFVTKAATNSEWDSVVGFLVELDDYFLDCVKTLQEMKMKVEETKKEHQFDLSIGLNGSLFFYDFHFAKGEEDVQEGIYTLDESIVENLNLPETHMDNTADMKLRDGFLTVTAFGEHTGEEFYAEIALSDIFEEETTSIVKNYKTTT